MTFAKWIDFEAARIVRMDLLLSEKHRAEYIKVQMQDALKKAFHHGGDGLTEADEPRAVR